MGTLDPQEESQQFVNLRRIRDLPIALVLKSVLDSAGVECLLGDENTVRMDWFWSNLLGGIKLWVRLRDADDAADLLDQGIPESFDVEGVGEYVQPRCPNCQSYDVSFEGLIKRVAYFCLFVGLPVPLKRRGWKCDSCGRAWAEPRDTPQQAP
jgi:hypothetical protein